MPASTPAQSPENSEYAGVCPACHGVVGKRPDGSLFAHKRYTDGGGAAAGLSHERVPCEGQMQDSTPAQSPKRRLRLRQSHCQNCSHDITGSDTPAPVAGVYCSTECQNEYEGTTPAQSPESRSAPCLACGQSRDGHRQPGTTGLRCPTPETERREPLNFDEVTCGAPGYLDPLAPGDVSARCGLIKDHPDPEDHCGYILAEWSGPARPTED